MVYPVTDFSEKAILLQGATIHTSEGLLMDVIPRKVSASKALAHSTEQPMNGFSQEEVDMSGRLI